MRMSGSIHRIAILLCTATVVSCTRSGPRDGTDHQAGVVDGCPAARNEALAGTMVRARYAPFEIRLPPGARRQETGQGAYKPGEGWLLAPGLSVGYAVEADSVAETPFEADERVGRCSEVIGGRPANVLLVYSEQTYAPGQSVRARWNLPNGEMLSVHAFSYDSTRKADMMDIIRSVRFVAADSTGAASGDTASGDGDHPAAPSRD